MDSRKLQLSTCISIGLTLVAASHAIAETATFEESRTIAYASAKDETTLLLKVKAALAVDPALKGQTIEVGALGRTITLYGSVDTPERRNKAMQIASNVDGVKSVKSNLLVIKNS